MAINSHYHGEGLHVSFRDLDFSLSVAVFVYKDAQGGHQLLTKAGEWKFVAEGFYEPEPTMVLPAAAMQALMNGLWGHGLRPSERRHEEEINLVKYHLEDMRRLVFGPPKKEEATK